MYQPTNNLIYQGPIVKRKDAKAEGQKWYFEGSTCQMGHVDRRQTSNGCCYSCRAALREKYKDKTKACKDRLRSNPEYVARENEKTKERYRKNPKAALVHCRNRQARSIQADGRFSLKDVETILEKQSQICVYCKSDISSYYEIDHIMPLALGGSNWPENLQCLCRNCNRRKSSKHPDDWHKEIGFTKL